MANKKQNAFSMYAQKTETAVIEALGGAEVTYRKLTMDENDEIQKHAIKGFTKEGDPDLDMTKYAEVKYMKVSKMLVTPKMSVEELKSLSEDALAAINEIVALGSDVEGDDEGN